MKLVMITYREMLTHSNWSKITKLCQLYNLFNESLLWFCNFK